MCGICGVIQIEGEPRILMDSARLQAMTDAMVHRGPDDRGMYLTQGVAFGARRLSIVDVEGGHQPLFSEDGSICAMQNGELYNHAELRVSLRARGHGFGSRCDTEILPHLYEQHGDDLFSQLQGKFAVAIWDGNRHRAVLGRDRLGVKPLYWARVDDMIVFASELKSMIASGLIKPDVDEAAIELYLTLGYIPGPRTPFRQVRKLAPGSFLVIDGTVREEVYWEYPRPASAAVALSMAEEAQILLRLLDDAVADRLMGDVPLGAMLSGGLDSSMIVALMARHLPAPGHTFAVGFEGDPASELTDARSVADRFECTHHALALSLDNTPSLDDLVWRLDEPVADLSVVGFDALCRLAREQVTVALSGQGADELFGGYRKHRAVAVVRDLGGIGSRVARGLRGVPMPPGRATRAVRTFGEVDATKRLLEMSALANPQTLRGLMGDDTNAATELALDVVAGVRGDLTGDPLALTLYLDARLGLVDHLLLYFDRISMAHSLEVRVPFLDHRLVEWAATVPTRHKVSGTATKRVLRMAGQDLVPETVLRKRKQGFLRESTTLWVRRYLDSDAGARIAERDARCFELLDRRAVHELIGAFRQHPSEEGARLILAILILDAWLDRFSGYAGAATAGLK